MIKKIFRAIKMKVVNFLFDLFCRIRFRNDDFSIICPNCIGGVIYHRVGKRFLSPTINLFILQPDFMKLIKNLKWYMEQELVFFEQELGFPNARLDDICIFFNHSKNEEEAKNDWDRRKERIIWDSIVIIMYETDEISREQLLELKEIECKKIIVLTSKKSNLDIPYVHYIKPSDKGRANEEFFIDKDNWGLRTFEKQWDFVSWLNT